MKKNDLSILALSALSALSALLTLTAGPALAAGDAAAGEALFAGCKACHAMEAGKNGLGPSLAGMFGRPAGGVAGYAYSDAMKASGIVWTDDTVAAYLANPRENLPGTKMIFPGMRDPQQVEDMIAYIKQAAQ